MADLGQRKSEEDPGELGRDPFEIPFHTSVDDTAAEAAKALRSNGHARNGNGHDGSFVGGTTGADLSDATAEAVSKAAALAEQRCKLARTIEGEVIPRLMLAHGAGPARRVRADHGAESVTPSDDDVAELARLVVTRDLPEALSFVDGLRDRGIASESVFLHVFAPAARLLGRFWETDRCSFAEVTIGLSRLQQLMRELSPALERAFDQPESEHKVLLVPAPGEQHTFGLSMLGVLFRQAGFTVYDGELLHAQDVPDLVRHERFDAIGITASTHDRLDALTDMIRRVRRSLAEADTHIMVGGNLFLDRPERVVEVGADAMAVDGRQAVLHMQARLKRKGTARSSGPPSSRGAEPGNVHTAPWAGEPLQDSRNIAARY